MTTTQNLHTPTPAPKKRRRWIAPVAVAAALLGGIGIGAAGEPEPEVRTVTQTQTVEKEVPVEVERTPASCLQALDDAEALNQLNIEVLTITSEMFGAASEFDVAGIEAGNAELDGLHGPVEDAVAAYNGSSESCRSAG